jgi:hypothetical protein
MAGRLLGLLCEDVDDNHPLADGCDIDGTGDAGTLRSRTWLIMPFLAMVVGMAK